LDHHTLRSKLAQHHRVSVDQIVIGNGSDQLIHESIRLFSGDSVVTFPPTFSMYRFYSSLESLKTWAFPLGTDFHIPLPQEVPQTDWRQCRVVFICSPNNPTGNCQPIDRIEAWLQIGTAVVVDEAYVDFCDQDLTELAKRYPNLIRLRTFSKGMGMANLRLGYAIVSQSIGRLWNGTKPPFCLNGITAIFGAKAMESYEHFAWAHKEIRTERQRMYDRFSHCCYPSDANFLLFRTGGFHFLKKRGILVRPLSGSLEDHIRVTICAPEDNNKFQEAYRTWLEERGL
jgi:histidinol-phosphate aminotransferase